jgi:hypothetical protein
MRLVPRYSSVYRLMSSIRPPSDCDYRRFPLRAVRSAVVIVVAALVVRATASAPIVGAALLGLDELGAPPEAKARAREQLAIAAGEGAE